MRTRLPLLIAVAAALAAPATAGAGGFATVGVNPLPEGIDPGEPWNVELTVLQHGRTPLEGVHPRVIATRGSERREFAARATDRPGVYSAEVVFPDAGKWKYVVDDGFTQTHSFPPVTVGGGAVRSRPHDVRRRRARHPARARRGRARRPRGRARQHGAAAPAAGDRGRLI